MDLSEGEILDEETLALFSDQLDYSDPKDMERFWKAHDACQARFGDSGRHITPYLRFRLLFGLRTINHGISFVCLLNISGHCRIKV